MTREDYIKKLISENGMTIKDFAAKINMPYSTLLTMLNEHRIGRASVDNVIAVCKGLDISINELQTVLASDNVKKTRLPESRVILTEKEKALVLAYRSRRSMQEAVDTLLLSPTPGR